MTSKAEPQYITLQEWAKRKFSKPPAANTLWRWANDGTIQPKPIKMGRDFHVLPTARHVNEPAPAPDATLADRIRNGLTTKRRNGLQTA